MRKGVVFLFKYSLLLIILIQCQCKENVTALNLNNINSISDKEQQNLVLFDQSRLENTTSNSNNSNDLLFSYYFAALIVIFIALTVPALIILVNFSVLLFDYCRCVRNENLCIIIYKKLSLYEKKIDKSSSKKYTKSHSFNYSDIKHFKYAYNNGDRHFPIFESTSEVAESCEFMRKPLNSSFLVHKKNKIQKTSDDLFDPIVGLDMVIISLFFLIKHKNVATRR
jgi:hypothetical protein